LKVLVTGASGFFGRGIMDELRSHGHAVDGAARRVDGTYANVALDITDRDAVRAVLTCGYEGVVHCAALAHVRLAAEAAARADAVNAVGSANVVEMASLAGVANYVFISSVMVYGDHSLPAPVTEDAPLQAIGAYGAAKIAAERATLAAPPPMRRTILRMATMYATDWLFNVRKRVAVPLIDRWFSFSLEPTLPRYSLCSRAGGARVVRAALEAAIPQGIFNVADDHVYTQREIRAAVTRIEGPTVAIPVPLIIPRLALKAAETFARGPRLEAARSRYWKFCEKNVYSTARLGAAGIRLPPQLLDACAPA